MPETGLRNDIVHQPLEAIQARAREDRTTVNWHLDDYDTDTAGNIAIQADVALVFINSDSGEQYITIDGNEGDRNNPTAWNNGDNLVQAVAAQNEHTIVVVHSVGPLIVEPWIANPNITAVGDSLAYWVALRCAQALIRSSGLAYQEQKRVTLS